MKAISKTIGILILLSLSITLIGCNKQKSNINEFIEESQLESIVSKSICESNAPSDITKVVFESHEIIGKELKDDILSVYVIAYYWGVYDDNGDFGGEYPAHIKIQKIENDYKVVERKSTEESMGVYHIMPEKYAKDILKYDTSSLHQIVKKQVEDWKKDNQSNK